MWCRIKERSRWSRTQDFGEAKQQTKCTTWVLTDFDDFHLYLYFCYNVNGINHERFSSIILFLYLIYVHNKMKTQ